MIKDPAFPVSNGVDTDFGMTVRQYYKTEAINRCVIINGDDHVGAARWCGAFADAMIAEDKEHENK